MVDVTPGKGALWPDGHDAGLCPRLSSRRPASGASAGVAIAAGRSAPTYPAAGHAASSSVPVRSVAANAAGERIPSELCGLRWL